MIDEQNLKPQDELREDELEQVAGGFDPQPDPPTEDVNENFTAISNIMKAKNGTASGIISN
jgi:hypothetical protein